MRILKRFRTAARFRRFRVPVETFTPPYLILSVLFLYCPVNSARRISFSRRLTLVMQLFALAQPELYLYERTLEIKRKRHKRQSLLLYGSEQPHYLPLVQKKTPVPCGVFIEYIAMLVGTYMHLLDYHFSVFNGTPRVLKVGAALPYRLYLGARKLDAAFKALKHKILMESLFVCCDCFDIIHTAYLLPGIKV